MEMCVRLLDIYNNINTKSRLKPFQKLFFSRRRQADGHLYIHLPPAVLNRNVYRADIYEMSFKNVKNYSDRHIRNSAARRA